MNRVSFKKLLKQSFLEFQSLFMSFRFNKKSKIALEEANNRLNSVYSFSDKINNTTIINKRATYITNDIDKYTSLSIITCAYNTDEKLLRKCLNSLINQNTKYQYEIILIDDGSQNNTLDVIKEYASSCEKIKVLTQLNGGPGKARNNGLMHSEGEYIAFVDSDNFIDYGFVEKVLNKAYEQNYDIVKVGYKKIKEGIISEHLYKDECYVNDFSFALKYDGFLWGAVYKREFFKKILLPEQIAFEDMIVRLTLYRKANTFCYISESLYYYNDYSTNTTNGVSKTNFNRLDHLCLLEVILRDNEKIGIPLDDIEKSLILSELGFMFWYRIAHLPLNVKECAFIYASHNIIDKYIADIERSKFSRIERQIYDCYKNRDFNKWLIIGRMH